MKLGVYAIYDKKAVLYKSPYLSHNEDVAIRMFGNAVNGAESELSAYPEDFDLYRLAHFNDEDGTYNNEPSPTIICNGQNVVRRMPTFPVEVPDNGEDEIT